jgi:hypothetical protein
MTNKLNADDLLREAFEVLAPHGSGSSAEADRKTALREKIGRYLGSQGKQVAGGGGGGPATFGGSPTDVSRAGNARPDLTWREAMKAPD